MGKLTDILEKLTKRLEESVSNLEKKVDNFEQKAHQFEDDINQGKYDPKEDKPLAWWQAMLVIIVNFLSISFISWLMTLLFSARTALITTIMTCGFYLLVGIGMLFYSFNSYRITGVLLILSNCLIFYYFFY